jgi:hypothetical protein
VDSFGPTGFGSRSPCTVIFDAAVSISRKSSDLSSTSTAPMLSSRRSSFRGTRDGNDLGTGQTSAWAVLGRTPRTYAAHHPGAHIPTTYGAELAVDHAPPPACPPTSRGSSSSSVRVPGRVVHGIFHDATAPESSSGHISWRRDLHRSRSRYHVRRRAVP